MAAYDLDTLKFFSTRPESKHVSEVICLCSPEEMGQYCNVLLCGYPALKKLTCKNPKVTYIPPLLVCRLNSLDISGTSIAELPLHGCAIEWLDASNTRVDPYPLVKNWQFLKYCKTGYLEGSSHYETHPRRVYENPTEILAVRLFLVR